MLCYCVLQMVQTENPTMQVEHAISDGYDVRSFLYWTLVDNFEVRSYLPAPAAGASPGCTLIWHVQARLRALRCAAASLPSAQKNGRESVSAGALGGSLEQQVLTNRDVSRRML